MDLLQKVENLEEEKQIRLAVSLLKLCLPIWYEFNSNSVQYVDSVVGMTHAINKNLIEETIILAEKSLKCNTGTEFKKIEVKLKSKKSEFLEHIVSVSDNDLRLPAHVDLILNSASNLVNKLLGENLSIQGEPMIYISINQSIDVLLKSNKMNIEDINSLMEQSF